MLGVNVGDPLTALRVDLKVRDLGEFDQLLQTLGLEANGKKGTAAIPVVLHGAVEFNGTAQGRDCGSGFEGASAGYEMRGEAGHGDGLDDRLGGGGCGVFSESGLAIASSTIKRGTAVLNVEGTFKPRKTGFAQGCCRSMRGTKALAMDAKVQLANAQVADVLQIAGQQQKMPVTGTIGCECPCDGNVERILRGVGRSR